MFGNQKIQYKWLPGSSKCEFKVLTLKLLVLEFAGPRIRETQSSMTFGLKSSKQKVLAKSSSNRFWMFGGIGELDNGERPQQRSSICWACACVCVYKVKLQINNYFLVLRLGQLKKKSNRTSRWHFWNRAVKVVGTLSDAWSSPSLVMFIAHDNSVVISGGWVEFWSGAAPVCVC